MPATDAADATSFPYPMRIHDDPAAGRLRVVVDAYPTAIDDVTVAVGPTRVRIAIDRGDERHVRTLEPLSGDRVFGDDRRAVYRNGVLTVSLETAPTGRTGRRR